MPFEKILPEGWGWHVVLPAMKLKKE